MADIFHTARTFVDSSAPPWGDTDDGDGTVFRPGDRWVDDRDGGVFTYLAAASGEWAQVGEGVYTMASDLTRTTTTPIALFTMPIVSGRVYRIEWDVLSSGTTTAVPGMQLNWSGTGDSAGTGLMTSASETDGRVISYRDGVTAASVQYPAASNVYLFHGVALVQASSVGSVIIYGTEHGTGTATFLAGSRALLRDVGAV